MPPEPFQLLLAVNDAALRDALAASLTAAGFHSEQIGSVHEAIDIARRQRFDAVLISFGPGDLKGIEVCRRLRAISRDIGIVMVRTGGSPEDDVYALDAGADDCIAAPFRFREIVARLSAVLRRFQADVATKAKVLRAGQLEMDVERRRFWRGSQEIHLSPREFDLLLFLMEHRGVTLTHLKLLRAVWGTSSGHDSTYLRSYIKALRRKIETNPARPEYILTEPWVGYRFNDPGAGLASPS
jgi:two-component system KDP operon response regulator KdpE